MRDWFERATTLVDDDRAAPFDRGRLAFACGQMIQLYGAHDRAAALLSAADRCELPPGAHPAALAALHPDAYARELANQFVAAGAESLGSRAESSAKPADAAADPNGDPSGAPASARLAAFALGRICRRGNARRAADALVSRVLDADGGFAPNDRQRELLNFRPDPGEPRTAPL